MGLRLLFLSLWTPKYIIRRELDNIFNRTTKALKELVSKYVKEEPSFAAQEYTLPTSIQQKRAAMAQTHAKLVETLATSIGTEEAIRLGRETLFSVGKNLGKQNRIKLGVGDNPKDLIKAAKILYRVLGIEFHLEWLDRSRVNAIIERCALAEHYSELTCKVLSAIDEGVIEGLQPTVTMNFKEYMTSNGQNCNAEIQFHKKEITQ